MPQGPPSNSPPSGGPTSSSPAPPDKSSGSAGAERKEEAERGKVIRLMYCEVCRKPVAARAVRRFQFFHMVLCDPCYNKFYRRGR